jgi:hypothetical protein
MFQIKRWLMAFGTHCDDDDGVRVVWYGRRGDGMTNENGTGGYSHPYFSMIPVQPAGTPPPPPIKPYQYSKKSRMRKF